ncbi:hypothetical protein MFLAVUS_006680 [Mucor flavus]|uniref:Uncharacterized protein n=1 Tax=Mucor flavus TaxID=439312 RepID=A0ABP9Z273_9FUNG
MKNLRNVRAIPANNPLKLSRKGQATFSSYTQGTTISVTLSNVSGELARHARNIKNKMKLAHKATDQISRHTEEANAEENDNSTEINGVAETFTEASDEVSDEDSDDNKDETSDDADIMSDGYNLSAAFRKFRQLMQTKAKQVGFYLDANLLELLYVE